VTYDGDLTSGIPGQAVTLTLADEIDISRGDMLVSPDHLPMVSSRLQARLVWMSEHALETGKEYLFRFGNLTVPGNVEKIEHRVDMSTLEQMPADALEMNGIGEVVVQLSRRVPFDLYSRIRETGAFIMIDRMTNATLSAGMVSGMLEDTSLARVANDVRPVTGVERQDRNGHTALVVALRGACAAEAAVKMERVLFDRHGLVIRLDVSGQSLSETEAQALLARSAGMVLLMVDPAENAGADLSFQLSTLDDLNAAMNTLLSRL
jgi:sulfate adenylyltransferase subunit 1 (EFTu-like GTPase family)